MIEYIYNDTLVGWAEKRIPGMRFRGDAHAFGITVDGGLRAAVVWDNFSDNGCFISVASDGGRDWFTREMARRACYYPFVQCGFHRMAAIVSVKNFASLVLVRRFGFIPEGRLREAGDDGEDMIIYGMLKHECTWLDDRPTLPVVAMAV